MTAFQTKPALYAEPDPLAGTTPTTEPMPGTEAPAEPASDAAKDRVAGERLVQELLQKGFKPKGDVDLVGGQLVAKDLEGVQRIAKGLSRSGLRKQGKELSEFQWWVILTAGYSSGLTTGEIMKNVDLINDRPVLWGDAIPGLIWRSGWCEGIEDTWEGTGPTRVAVCTMHRMTKSGVKTVTRRFGHEDAKRADLLKKDTYQKFPDRMYQVRARAWCAKDLFPDVIGGLSIAEEIADIDGFDPAKMAGPSAALPEPN